jgi:hypothetical protein
LGRRSITQPKAKFAHFVAEDQISSVSTESLGEHSSKLCGIKRPSMGKPFGCGFEDNDRRKCLRSPEYRRLIGRKPWIDGETRAPNAGRGLRSSCPRSRRRRRLLGRSSRSLLDTPGYVAGIPTRSRADRDVSGSHFQRETASLKQQASQAPEMRCTERMASQPLIRIRVRGVVPGRHALRITYARAASLSRTKRNDLSRLNTTFVLSTNSESFFPIRAQPRHPMPQQ